MYEYYCDTFVSALPEHIATKWKLKKTFPLPDFTGYIRQTVEHVTELWHDLHTGSKASSFCALTP